MSTLFLKPFLSVALLFLLPIPVQSSPQISPIAKHNPRSNLSPLNCSTNGRTIGWTSVLESCSISGSKLSTSDDSLTKLLVRGGSSAAAAVDKDDEVIEESSDEEEDTEVADDVNEDEYDLEETDVYDEEDTDDEDEYEVESDVDDDETDPSTEVDVEYDTMLAASSMQSMGVTMGVMLLTRNLDLTNKKTIQYARFAYLAYIIISQIFFAYVRIQAKLINDRTPITITNPLTSLVKNQLNTALNNKGDGESSASSAPTKSMAKDLTDKFLSSQSTIMEYDMNQSRKLGSGGLFSLAFMWFLHFKMNQVQPLFFQTASGILNLVYSPLFQVYVLGRNLERPFKTPSPMGPGANPFAPNESQEGDEDEESNEVAAEDDDVKEQEAEGGEDEEEDGDSEEYEDEDSDDSDEDE